MDMGIDGLIDTYQPVYIPNCPFNQVEDLEAWARWFDRTKAQRDELSNIMTSEGIRVLPTATKGTSWEQLASDARPAAPGRMDIGVLHGQAGGGS